MAARDPQVAARLWGQVNQIENGRAREVLTEGLLEHIAAEDGATGVAEAFSRIENLEQKEHERLLFNTSLNTRYTDLAGTVALFREHSTTDEYRTKNVVDAFRYWAKRHRAAAAEWLREEPPSNERDLMIVELIEKIPSGDPEIALGWAREIGDEYLRTQMTSRFE